MTTMALAVPASERILSRIISVQTQLENAQAAGDTVKAECHAKVRQAYLVDLIDVLNEEEQAKPKDKRKSFNLASTEAWIKKNSKTSTG